jgi:hypothetical protein
VGAIAPRLGQVEIERSKRKPTESLDAYDCYLRGMVGIHRWTPEGINEVPPLFYRAIELDPNFFGPWDGGAVLLSAQGERARPRAADFQSRTSRCVSQIGRFHQVGRRPEKSGFAGVIASNRSAACGTSAHYSVNCPPA